MFGCSSNRTFMELKLNTIWTNQNRSISSNRTFMELKSYKIIDTAFEYNCSNRTFMELKYNRACKEQKPH